MESLLANVAKMMAWYAQLEVGKRLSSSNYLEGESHPPPPIRLDPSRLRSELQNIC
jgi:hypothetical protein